MAVNKKDREILRQLAQQVAEIAALPVQQETIAMWKALNGLKPVRPMVMIDQIAWHEMEFDGELTLHTEDGSCHGYESWLRKLLYSWKHMRVDMVVEPVVEVGKAIYAKGGYEPGVQEQTAVLDPDNGVVGHYYLDQLKTEEDLKKIRLPELVHDEKATAERAEKAHDIFDGILEIRLQGMIPMYNLWDRLATWRGPESLLWDLVDRPEFIHQIMARIIAAQTSLLDQLEKNGWLGHSQGTIHCTGAYTDELPAPGFNPEHPRAKDLWTCGMAQLFSTVSPAMQQAFELDYTEKLYARYGLVYYGCCEPLDGKIDIIKKKVPHVRKISMSPWVNLERGASQIGRDFVFSRKPSPAFLCVDDWNPKNVEQDLRETLQTCARHGCPLEFILKDISTVRYQPQRLWEWADIAMRLVQEANQ
jgi:hypothetical protein